MDNNENPNLIAFVNDFKKMMGKLEMESGELVYLTDDNSFPDFLIGFCGNIGADIERAIKDEDAKPKEPGYIENSFDRYIFSVVDNLAIKSINERLQSVLLDTHILFNNWLRMIAESDLFSTFCVSEKVITAMINMIADTDDILKGTMNLEKLVWMTGNLIAKAKEVIAAVPPSFNISEHYTKAINKALED